MSQCNTAGLLLVTSDGRALTEYRNSNQITRTMMKDLGITSSYDYKEYLINNGKTIRQAQTTFYKNNTTCPPNSNTADLNMIAPDPNDADAYWKKYRDNLSK